MHASSVKSCKHLCHTQALIYPPELLELLLLLNLIPLNKQLMVLSKMNWARALPVVWMKQMSSWGSFCLEPDCTHLRELCKSLGHVIKELMSRVWGEGPRTGPMGYTKGLEHMDIRAVPYVNQIMIFTRLCQDTKMTWFQAPVWRSWQFMERTVAMCYVKCWEEGTGREQRGDLEPNWSIQEGFLEEEFSWEQFDYIFVWLKPFSSFLLLPGLTSIYVVTGPP